MGWIITVANVAIYALAIWLISILLKLDRIKSIVSAVLGVLLAKGIMQIIPLGGLLNILVMILCVALISWLLGRDRFKALLAAMLGVLLGNLINGLVMPILTGIFGG